MKEGKMMTIEEILEGMKEEERKEIQNEITAGLYAICCEDVQWLKFKVYYRNDYRIMYYILEHPEFIMAISDYLQSEMHGVETVKIAVSKGKEKDISFIRITKTTAIVNISIPSKEWDSCIEKNK